MCLIIFAKDAHPRYKFVLAANRDEFYARSTAPANIWKGAPEVLAGRDLAAGGTWLGITTNGRFAAVTNYRDPSAPVGEKSRGDLTKNFLASEETAREFLRKIERDKKNIRALICSSAISELAKPNFFIFQIAAKNRKTYQTEFTV